MNRVTFASGAFTVHCSYFLNDYAGISDHPKVVRYQAALHAESILSLKILRVYLWESNLFFKMLKSNITGYDWLILNINGAKRCIFGLSEQARYWYLQSRNFLFHRPGQPTSKEQINNILRQLRNQPGDSRDEILS